MLDLVRAEASVRGERGPTSDVAAVIGTSSRTSARRQPPEGKCSPTHVAPALPQVLIDPVYLTEALRHLVENAIRYAPVDGDIRVSADVCASTGASEDLRRVLLRVRDSGPGIAAHARPRLFQRFFRVAAPQHH